MTTVTYLANKPYSGNCPWADVRLDPAAAVVVTLKCLVDTGADYLQINAFDARAAGFSLAGATSVPVSTAAGSATLQKLTGVKVSIEGSRTLTVDVLVDPTNSTKPCLAGRQLLIAAFDVGFNASEWLNT